jgi:hypothetical protein
MICVVELIDVSAIHVTGCGMNYSHKMDGARNPSGNRRTSEIQKYQEVRFIPLVQGELLALNNFLSTSHNRDVFLRFTRRIIHTSSFGVCAAYDES